MPPSALFDACTCASTSDMRPAADCEFSAFLRVIDAISSIDDEVSSSDAACSVEPCDSDCEEFDTWLDADSDWRADSAISVAIAVISFFVELTMKNTATPMKRNEQAIPMTIT